MPSVGQAAEGQGIWKSGRGKGRATPKGRQLDDAAWDEVRALLGDRPRRRDLLIEFLHLIQDEYGHLSAAHLRALAEEMRLSMAEVYEVATFYAHFDVIREGETPPPALTIRVCDSLACEMAGADALRTALARRAGPDRGARFAGALYGAVRHGAGAGNRAQPHRSRDPGKGGCRDRRP